METRAPADGTTTAVVFSGPPETVALPAPTVDRACRAVWIAAAFALYAIVPVCWPRKHSLYVPAVAPFVARVCTSVAAVPAAIVSIGRPVIADSSGIDRDPAFTGRSALLFQFPVDMMPSCPSFWKS